MVRALWKRARKAAIWALVTADDHTTTAAAAAAAAVANRNTIPTGAPLETRPEPSIDRGNFTY